jgi:acyl-CoA thioesterase-2
MSEALDGVVALLDLEQIELNIFRGRSPEGERRQRVFGGQVAGQALVAAGRTVPADRPVHSLHAYFIRPGDPAVPLVYLVDRVSGTAGRSPPAGCPRSSTGRRSSRCPPRSTTRNRARARLSRCRRRRRRSRSTPTASGCCGCSARRRVIFSVAIRSTCAHIGPLSFEAERDPSLRTTSNLVWLRADGDLPDDPLLHVCLMTYASDMTLLDSVLLAHGLSWRTGGRRGPAWITRCGSTGRSGPTDGCCTRRIRQWPEARGDWPVARSSPPRANLWCLWSRRG